MTVQRFSTYGEQLCHVPTESGQWVKYEDYLKLARQQVKTIGVFLLRFRNNDEIVHEYYAESVECNRLNARLSALSLEPLVSDIEVFRLVGVPLVKKTILSLPKA